MDFFKILSDLFVGFGFSLGLFAITLIVAIPLGLCIAFCSMSKLKPIKWLSQCFVWIIRGTPLMLQIIVITFVPITVLKILNKDLASIFGLSIASLNFVFASTAFILNYACYFSEIFRGGIESISKGQFEAGQVLGMKRGQIFNKIIFIQVVKRILAPISNEVITLVKDTSLARIIGITELIFVAQSLVNIKVSLTPLFVAGLFYLIFNGILTLLFKYLERKMLFIKV